MKKIILGLTLIASAAFTSCDMDTTRYGSIGQENAIESRDDAFNFLNGIYIQIRSMSAGAKYSAGDIQMDKFVGTIDNANRMGPFSNGNITVSDQDITSYYQSAYNAINEANYFIPKCEALLDREDVTDTEKAEIRSMIAVGHFCRAMAYVYLFDKFVDYKEAELETEGKGLQIVTEYKPSGDRGSYVGRSSIRKTVEYINNELTLAFDGMVEWDLSGNNDGNMGPETAYLNEYVVAALQSRFALLTNDYSTALSKAEHVINSGLYDLVGTDSYADMWVNDSGSELIFVPYAEKAKGGGFAIGQTWLTNANKTTSDYIPTAATLLAYEDNDIRFESFFEVYQINSSGVNCQAFVFSKFPGNPALWTTTSNNLQNKAKPFRLSELYLIAAEVCATDGPVKNESKANEYLNAIREARIDGYQSTTSTGKALVNAIREERAKELIGEGFRQSDLRRGGLGFTRNANLASLGTPLDKGMEFILVSTDNISYEPGDYRLVWPIPYREMSVNPQLKGQQNPGY